MTISFVTSIIMLGLGAVFHIIYRNFYGVQTIGTEDIRIYNAQNCDVYPWDTIASVEKRGTGRFLKWSSTSYSLTTKDDKKRVFHTCCPKVIEILKEVCTPC